jgi:t-SNARE complex subunit (syntaxin)
VNTHELKDSKKQLKRHLKSADSTLKDVMTTVLMIETDRGKFENIDDGQLFERKSLVNTSRERLSKAKEELNSESVRLKLVEDEKQKAIRRSGDGLLGARTDQERHNTDFVLNNQAQSSLLMQQQDETLDELGEAVNRVGEMAGTIHEEIELQNQMLEELDEDMTRVEEELGMIMGKLAKFLKTKNKWHLRTILVLSLIVVILFFLVLYT